MKRAAAIAALGVVLGCGHTVRDAVHDGIDEATRPANVKKVTGAAHDLASALTEGVIDGSPPGKMIEHLAPLVEQLVRTTMHTAAAELDAELSPAVARAVRTSLDAAIAGLIDPSTRRGLVETETALIGAAMTGLERGLHDHVGPALAEAIDASLGPALQRAIGKLGPALAQALDHDLKPVLIDTARQTAAAAGAGAFDGVQGRAEPALERLSERLRVELAQAKQDAHSVLEMILIAVLAIAAGVLGVVAWLRHRAAVGAGDALQLVTSQIGQARDEPDVLRLAGRIRTAGQNTRGGEYLSRHLRTHPAIKISSAKLS